MMICFKLLLSNFAVYYSRFEGIVSIVSWALSKTHKATYHESHYLYFSLLVYAVSLTSWEHGRGVVLEKGMA